MNKINENIKDKRIAKGMTQEELAKIVYTTKSTISKWESGAITPGVDMIKIIAKALDVKFYEILGEETPIRMKIFDWIGRVLIYLFAWIHIDITFTGIVTMLGAASALIGVVAGAGGWIAYIVLYSITSWTDGASLIVIGALSAGPFIFALFFSGGYVLLNIARWTANFSLKWFWKSNKRIPKIKMFKIKKWMIYLVIASFAVGAIFLSIGASIHPDQLNFEFS